jgi:tRNA (cytidine/uridine-2'-O-)-methyltransferase
LVAGFAVPRTTNETKRLRISPVDPPFHVVLVAPEIPPNTGSVARLCAATGSPLHLVRPLGFSLDEKAVRRAGVDYWHLVDVRVHENFQAFVEAFAATLPAGEIVASRMHLLSGIAEKSYTDAAFRGGDALIFGQESVGLAAELLASYKEQTLGIPTVLLAAQGSEAAKGVRSLNVANAVGIVLFEALRQAGAFSRATMA